MLVIQRSTRRGSRARSTANRPISLVIFAAPYRTSPVTQKLVMKRRTRRFERSLYIATIWHSASFGPAGDSKSGKGGNFLLLRKECDALDADPAYRSTLGGEIFNSDAEVEKSEMEESF